MELTWMGRYRKFVEYLDRFGNAYAQHYMVEKTFDTPIAFSALQLQVMEYILENEEENQSMIEIATRLGISASTFSKNVKKMAEKGLLEKYYASGNRKEVIVKVTPLGREMYALYAAYIQRVVFQPMFRILDGLSEEDLARFTEVIRLAATMGGTPRSVARRQRGELIPLRDR